MAYRPKANEESIQIEGLTQLFNALKAVGAPVEAIEEANKAAAQPVARTARNIAPVRSGRLRATIRVGPAKTNVKIRAGLKRVPYANPIHWGWFYDKNNFITKNIKPNPFMSRALGYNRDDILKQYVASIQKLINKYEPPKSVKKWW
jgi:HK97 gp10 family phage protein